MRALTLSLVCLAAGLSGASPAAATDMKLLTAGAFKQVAVALVPGFTMQTSNMVVIENETAGVLTKRIAGGEAFDVVVLTPAALDQLTKAGKIVPGSAVPVARVAIGVAVKDGAPKPDISTVEAFKNTLLKARAVAYIDPAAGGSSGIYLSQLFEKMGIAAAIKPKAVLVPGGLVATRVVSGEADIGIHQISEILAVKGASLVGPLPAEIQNYTVYAAGISTGAKNPQAARELVAAFKSASALKVLKESGLEPVP
jgi:molybdate transport system substrate-binding protein